MGGLVFLAIVNSIEISASEQDTSWLHPPPVF